MSGCTTGRWEGESVWVKGEELRALGCARGRHGRVIGTARSLATRATRRTPRRCFRASGVNERRVCGYALGARNQIGSLAARLVSCSLIRVRQVSPDWLLVESLECGPVGYVVISSEPEC